MKDRKMARPTCGGTAVGRLGDLVSSPLRSHETRCPFFGGGETRALRLAPFAPLAATRSGEHVAVLLVVLHTYCPDGDCRRISKTG